MKKFNFSCQYFYNNGDYYANDRVNAITFKNTGSSIVFINGVKLLPPPGVGFAGESFSISANEDEIFSGRITIVFAGGSGELEVIEQYYLP